MKTRHLSVLVLTAAVTGIPLTGDARIQCWTNSDGYTECGDRIPPEYAGKRTESYNQQGVVTEVRERAMTPEEIEAERVRQAEEQRRLEEERQRREQQAAYDRVLLQTFTAVEDIEMARDRRLAVIAGQIEITRLNIEKANETIMDYERRAAMMERAGQAIPEELLQDMERVRNQIANRNDYIATKRQEKEAIREAAAMDITRFRELMQLRGR